MGIYSILLVGIELLHQQDYVRNYFTDISGPVRFYAVNTTLSVFLLWSTALLFAVSVTLTDSSPLHRRTRAFYLSQILIFAYLGLDDRFMIHEWLGVRLKINDALILLGVGLLEIALLFFWGDIRKRSRSIQVNLFLAATFFAVMTGIDALLPSRMMLRLSLEDLAKTWANLFLFFFAWEICQHHIVILKQPGELHEKSIF